MEESMTRTKEPTTRIAFLAPSAAVSVRAARDTAPPTAVVTEARDRARNVRVMKWLEVVGP